MSKNKPTKFTSNLIKTKTQNVNQTLKAPKPICQPVVNLNETEALGLGSKIDLKNKINTSFKSFSQSRENSVDQSDKALETIIESKRASVNSNLNQNNFLSVHSSVKLNQSSNTLKTILSTSNKSGSNLNLSNACGNGSRQSVSFSDNASSFKDNSNPNNEPRYQRALSLNQANDEETQPMLLSKEDQEKQVALISMPVTTTQSVSDYDLSYLNKSDETNDFTNKNFLSPLDVTLNSSFVSSNTNYSASFVSRPPQSTAPVSIRVLHKSMTKGSKAMRVMGNNTTVLTGKLILHNRF